ncbi:hypothetical protein LCGC14_0391510 [marine sediment metagenome]|uniref:Uncharacterized protein n=1 Tax=marine sediment metagenome TaxID=412755 RepID=A0A0F9SZL5_9ZZZZ
MTNETQTSAAPGQEASSGILPATEGAGGPSTGFVFSDELRAALEATGAFTSSQLKALYEAEDELPNFSRDRYAGLDAFTKSTAYIAHEIITRYIGQQALSQEPSGPMPVKPPYLDKPDEYDPHNPSQVYTHVDGKLYRWDGKRGEQDNVSYEWGKLRPVVVVSHTDVGGVMVPDAAPASQAIRDGVDWFHWGYDCWIGNGGKPLGVVTQDVRDQVRLAQERSAGALISQRSLAALS